MISWLTTMIPFGSSSVIPRGMALLLIVVLALLFSSLVIAAIMQDLKIIQFRKQVLRDYGYRIDREQGLGLVHRPDQLVAAEAGKALRYSSRSKQVELLDVGRRLKRSKRSV